MTYLHQYADAALCRFWREGDGTLSWLIDLEAELIKRGYTTRDAKGKRIDAVKAGDRV